MAVRKFHPAVRGALAAAFVALWSASVRAQEQPATPRPEAAPPVSLADARSTFARFDANHDGRLDSGEMGAAKVDSEWLSLGDSNRDGTLSADEFVAAYPLLLARHGRVASVELEAEALRLRANQSPRPNATPRDPASLSKLRSGDGAKPAAPDAKLDESKSPTRSNGGATPPARVAIGPAAARLRSTPADAESQARVQAAREALDQRLRNAHQDGQEPAKPTAGPSEPVAKDSPNARRGADELVTGGLTAERVRAARAALDARIRAAAKDRPETRTDANSAAKDGGAKDDASKPATPNPDAASRAALRPRTGDAAPEAPRAGSAAPKRPQPIPNEAGARPRSTPAPAPERPHDERPGGGASSKPHDAPAHPDPRGGKGGG